VNIANGDMIGHTGNLDATVIGCTTTDKAIKVTFSSCTLLSRLSD
jgi:2,3-bisphosphoglycerate-independent phosphoglycerate mutase